MSACAHIPVLARETVAALEPATGKTFVDGTFGRGGISRALLTAADCRVLAIDRDPSAIETGQELEEEFSGRFRLFGGCFSDMEALLAPALGGKTGASVHGVTFDVGVSSPQLDEAERGFSFKDGPLDMRMGQSGPTAADIVNHAPEPVLAAILKVYGEERQAKRIAKVIVGRRAEAPIGRTGELAALVESVIGRRPGDKIHPATRTFQGLRIAVNDELRELALGLSAAERMLLPGGILAVVSFHSLEDRIVKRFVAERARPPGGRSRHLPDLPAAPEFAAQFVCDRTKPVTPGEAEISANPRARSSKLRSARRTDAPARPLDLSALALPEVNLE